MIDLPALVDTEPVGGGAPIAIFESGAMLLYLAEKIGRFIPSDLRGRVEVLKWLFWQVGGLGPMAGQNGHFNAHAPEKIAYAITRYVNETNRLYGVLAYGEAKDVYARSQTPMTEASRRILFGQTAAAVRR